MSTAEAEAEDLISYLLCGLHPATIYRTLVPLWRDYFHRPAEVAGWDYGQRRSSKRIGTPTLKDDRNRRRARPRLIG